MVNSLTIVERCSGYWVVDNSGVVAGPYIHRSSAVNKLKQITEKKK